MIERSWHGDELLARGNRATGRAALGMGEAASAEMSAVAHVLSGDLKRTIHVAVPDTTGEIPSNEETVKIGNDHFQLEVGSWLRYACVENNRGGLHRFADIGWELAKSTFDEKLVRAWREEGM